jgi:transcriptional regulator with XRE-family HTH domain
VVRQAVADTIRARVKELWKMRRPEMNQAEFGAAIGRGYSWVSAFLAGKRDANDVTLVVRIAKVLGVPAGYLLGDKAHPPRAGIAAVVAECQDLSEEDLGTVLRVAKSLPKQASGPSDEEGPAESPAPRPNRPRKRQ